MPAVRSALVVLVGLVAVAVVAGAVLAYLTFGTQRAAAPDPSSSADGVIASSMTSAEAPVAFRDRARLGSCGDVVLQQGGRIPAASIACLVGSAATGHELVVESPTTEGDPIVRYFRAGPDIDGVEVFEDATADRFGGGWHRSVCRSGRIDQFGACA
jgi:hypothetical protein